MKLQTPHRGRPIDATREAIREVIEELADQENPFAILADGEDGMTYIQTLCTPTGFILDYQEGSLDQHYRTLRGDLTEAEVIEAFGGYLDRNPAWRYAFQFERVEMRPRSFQLGVLVGRVLGRLMPRRPQ